VSAICSATTVPIAVSWPRFIPVCVISWEAIASEV